MSFFTKKKIDITVVLGAGNFGSGRGNTVKLSGLWASVNIQKGAAPAMDTADIVVWGMTRDTMNAVSKLGTPLGYVRNNGVIVEAGDDESGMTTVFSGTIQDASQDFQDAPNVGLNMGALGAGLFAMQPIAPNSVQGATDIASLMGTLAAGMGYTLENNGVTGTISNPYLPGTAVAQIGALAKAADIYCSIDESATTVAIWPKGGFREGAIPLISATTGMVGYPTFASLGIQVRSLFFPGVRFGGKIKIQSTGVPGATGEWIVQGLSYDLNTSPHGGAWFQDITGYNPLGSPI